MNIVLEKLAESLRSFSCQIALKTRNESITYRDLEANIEQWRIRSAEILLPNERKNRVGIVLPNLPEYLEVYYGILKTGSVPFLIDYNIGAVDLLDLMKDCGINYLIHDLSNAQREPQTPQFDLQAVYKRIGISKMSSPIPLTERYVLIDDTITCRFTSGTKGRPKCIEFNAASIYNAAQKWADCTNLTINDKVLCMAAISNGLAFNTSILSVLLKGAELHFFNGLQTVNNIVSYINSHQITRFVSYPTFYRLMVNSSHVLAIPSVKMAMSAGSNLWDEVRTKFKAKFGLSIVNYYGIAETGPITFSNNDDDNMSLGKLLIRNQLIVDDKCGEILVKTESMCSGYLNHPGHFHGKLTKEGFYRTGDTGSYVKESLRLTGRIDDTMNIAGRKIEPEELIKAAFCIDGVIDAAAFMEPDHNGENVITLALVKEERIDLALIKENLARKLSSYKMPSRIHVIKQIPRNGIGKILKHQLLMELNTKDNAEANHATGN